MIDFSEVSTDCLTVNLELLISLVFFCDPFSSDEGDFNLLTTDEEFVVVLILFSFGFWNFKILLILILLGDLVTGAEVGFSYFLCLSFLCFLDKSPIFFPRIERMPF